MFHPVQQTNGSFVGFAGVRCYFLGFCFLSREKKNLYAKKRVYERKSKCQFDEKMNEIVFGVCVEQLSRQLWHSWIWFAVANWLGLWILTVFCFLVCLISITFFLFSIFSIYVAFDDWCYGIFFFWFTIVRWMWVDCMGNIWYSFSHQSQPISKSIIKCVGVKEAKLLNRENTYIRNSPSENR